MFHKRWFPLTEILTDGEQGFSPFFSFGFYSICTFCCEKEINYIFSWLSVFVQELSIYIQQLGFLSVKIQI